jgi:mannosyltransferase OCH1-like enzyme
MRIPAPKNVGARLRAMLDPPPKGWSDPPHPGAPLLVPRIVHRIWLGPDPLPPEFASYGESWARLNPAWEVRLWTEDTIPEDLRRPEARERLRVPAERSDILRLELLWRHGGVYFDTDIECVRPLEPLIGGLDFFCAYLKPGQANNAVIGAAPGHPILDRALDEIRPREWYGYDKAAAGPEFLSSLLEDYPEVAVFAPELFYPNTPEQRETAYAIHYQARSWKGEEGFRVAALVAEERLERALEELQEERRRHERTQAELGRRRASPRRLLRPAHGDDGPAGRTE